jgi:hypothetical protein
MHLIASALYGKITRKLVKAIKTNTDIFIFAEIFYFKVTIF